MYECHVNVFRLCSKGIHLLLLSNQTFTPYCKLLTEFFPLRLMIEVRSASAISRMVKKKRESVSYSRDRKGEVSKIFNYISRVLNGSSHAERLQMTDVRQKRNDKF